MATCKQIRNNVYDFLDGELTPGQNKTVEKHIAGCKNCEAYLHNSKNVNHILELLGNQSGKGVATKIIPPTIES